jgi:hypothetical protein
MRPSSFNNPLSYSGIDLVLYILTKNYFMYRILFPLLLLLFAAWGGIYAQQKDTASAKKIADKGNEAGERKWRRAQHRITLKQPAQLADTLQRKNKH